MDIKKDNVKPPISPKEFIDNLPEGTILNKETYREAIEVYNKYCNYIFQEVCRVCGERLTTEELDRIDAKDFTITCFTHRVYRSFFRTPDLGFNKKRNPSNFLND